jgi:hypothetical protein
MRQQRSSRRDDSRSDAGADIEADGAVIAGGTPIADAVACSLSVSTSHVRRQSWRRANERAGR